MDDKTPESQEKPVERHWTPYGYVEKTSDGKSHKRYITAYGYTDKKPNYWSFSAPFTQPDDAEPSEAWKKDMAGRAVGIVISTIAVLVLLLIVLVIIFSVTQPH